MSFKEFIYDYFVVLVPCIGLLITMFVYTHIGKKNVNNLKIAVVELLVLTISRYIELSFRCADHPTLARLICSYICYVLPSFLVISLINIVWEEDHYRKYLYIPAIVNALIMSTCFYTKICFYYNEENGFVRGPLGYSTFISSGLYLILCAVVLIFYFKDNSLREGVVIIFAAASCGIAGILEQHHDTADLLNPTIGIAFVFVYIYLHIQISKRDSITNLRNRQSFYEDCERDNKRIKAIIGLDMNTLKVLNDTQGHFAGDAALRDLGVAFTECTRRKGRVYRTGGDEFNIICLNTTPEEVINLVKEIKTYVATNTKYSVAIGYAIRNDKEDLSTLYRLADEMMYEDKAAMKKEMKEKEVIK